MPPEPRLFEGLAAAPGIAVGAAFVYENEVPAAAVRRIPAEEVAGELARLEETIRETAEGITESRDRLARTLGDDHARIFDAHLFILQDEFLLGPARQLIADGLNAEAAFVQSCERAKAILRGAGSEVPDRRGDLNDVERRVVARLQGRSQQGLRDLKSPAIVVARDLTPSDVATMSRDKVQGFVTERGGATNHSVIIGRSLGIPVVTGARGILGQVATDDRIVLDGHSGRVTVHPDARALSECEQLRRRYEEREQRSLLYRDYPAETRDGKQIGLYANIELPPEADLAKGQGAGGIGLFRTEYLFLTAPDFPDEESQYQAYRKVIRTMSPQPVIVRTLDVGGEKVPSYMDFPGEENPSLGWRGIRYALSMEDIFRTQLRAILRAGEHGDLRIMFPMITGVEELRQARRILDEVREELLAEGQRISDELKVGIMVETPSAVAIAHLLAKEVDFFSIGSNDLIQYSLAIDRHNPKVSGLYEPYHPAILRQIRRSIRAARGQEIEVGLCGELPEDPLFLIILIGLGIDVISVTSYRIPEIKRIIRNITFDQARTLANRAWTYATAREIRRNAGRLAARKFPEIAELLQRGGEKP